MKNFINHFLAFIYFIASLGGFYAGQTVNFKSSFINLVCYAGGFFALMLACGKIDEIFGYGRFNKDDDDK
jgi:hypothetical protein